MQRLLFASALLICSTAAQAGASSSRTQAETDPPCIATADNDCETSTPASGNRVGNSQTGTDAKTRLAPPRRSVRGDMPRSGTLRFQSFLPGMIR